MAPPFLVLRYQVDKLLAAVHIEFCIDMLRVGCGGFSRYHEFVANVGDRATPGQKREDLRFARGEPERFRNREDGLLE